MSETQEQHILSLNDAKAQVENLVAQIDGTTRAAGQQRKIIDYYCVGEQKTTRSEESSGQDLLTYVFNFEDNNGYAIVHKYSTFVYVNYGWNGSSNGYYNAGVFNTNNGPVIQSTVSPNAHYQYDIDMIYGVRI